MITLGEISAAGPRPGTPGSSHIKGRRDEVEEADLDVLLARLLVIELCG
jgi:hypothetical protein